MVLSAVVLGVASLDTGELVAVLVAAVGAAALLGRALAYGKLKATLETATTELELRDRKIERLEGEIARLKDQNTKQAASIVALEARTDLTVLQEDAQRFHAELIEKLALLIDRQDTHFVRLEKALAVASEAIGRHQEQR